MIDVDKIVQEQSENFKDMPNEQKQNAIEMMTAFGNFMNCIWKAKEMENDGQDK